MILAAPLQEAIDELSKLPSIGKKTAQRLALHLLKSDAEAVKNLSAALIGLKEKLTFCKECFNVSENEVCDICGSVKRDHSVICVVEEASDVMAIEKTNEYEGIYHVLGGVLNPLAGKGPNEIRVSELVGRIKNGEVKEILLALNPDTEGETTTLYLAKLLKSFNVKITRIARGLPVGGDLEFADEATIGRAVLGRITIE